ncbi:MAG: hypothetical protein IT385_19475 [Deltaproteobacteria bacterium]|nr:hypothetical protein [Deltaproteobacteria bacterium]
MIRTAIRSLLSVATLVILTAGVARADIAPPPEDEDKGGCTAGGEPIALAALGAGLVIALRARRPQSENK